ncbi:hypothetical protein ACFL2Q_01800 [Thermodesulfobacteriota bacterium]
MSFRRKTIQLTHEEWEAICRKCGACCYEKLDFGGGAVHFTDKPCEHLDTETKLCRVYHKRQEAAPDCLKLTEALTRSLNWLPADCAYLEHLRFSDTLTAVRSAHKRRRRKRHSKRRR